MAASFSSDSDMNAYVQVAQKYIDTAKQKKGGIVVSDVVSSGVDGSELQWVDLVLAGGGMLGIAHVGYCYVLEELGIRFRGVGGTSAGAINAMLIAALRRDTPDQPSALNTLKIMATTNFEDFEDGKKSLKDLIGLLLLGQKPPGFLQGIKDVEDLIHGDLKDAIEKRGLNPADSFQKWISTTVLAEQAGIKDVEDLQKRYAFVDGDKRRVTLSKRADAGPISSDGKAEDLIAELKIVASDITTQTEAVFPEMADLYYKDPKNADPGDFVRASMSVPLFFQPKELSGIPWSTELEAKWKDLGYTGGHPKTDKVTFVDGGILSNLPVDLFHPRPGQDAPPGTGTNGVPLLPTFGVELSPDRTKAQDTSDLLSFLQAMVNTSSHLTDRQFIQHNPDFKFLLQVINTEGFFWLNFQMTDDEKLRLFERGCEAAQDYILGFDWPAYKKLRKQLAEEGLV